VIGASAARVRRGRMPAGLAALVAAFAAVPAAAPAFVDPLTVVLSLGLAALAVSILLRAGLLSFGHGLYYAGGAYAVAYALRAGLPGDAIAMVPLGAAAAGGLAALAGMFTVRYRGIFFAMLNLAFSMVAYTLLLKLYALTGGSDGMAVVWSSVGGLRFPPAALRFALFYLVLATAGVLGALAARYLSTPPGCALEAIESGEVRVEYLGISAHRVLLAAYVLSGVLAGAGGAAVALDVGHVVPDLSYWTTSSALVVVAILGGGGSVLGPFAGALVYELVSLTGARYMAGSWNLVLGLIILAVIRFAPGGLWGLAAGARGAWGSRGAGRAA
jgi:branched-chain amino acid transport system permease protein